MDAWGALEEEGLFCEHVLWAKHPGAHCMQGSRCSHGARVQEASLHPLSSHEVTRPHN